MNAIRLALGSALSAAWMLAISAPCAPAAAPSSPASSSSLSGASSPAASVSPTPYVLHVEMRDESGKESLKAIELQGNIDGKTRNALDEMEKQRLKSLPAQGSRPSKANSPSRPNPRPGAGPSARFPAGKAPAQRAPGARVSRRDAPATRSIRLHDAATSSPQQAFVNRNIHSNPQAREMLKNAQNLLRKGSSAEGNGMLKLLLIHWPNSIEAGEAHVALGRQAEAEGRWREAVHHLTDRTIEGLQVQRQSLGQRTLANAWISLREYDRARACAQKSITLTTDARQKAETQKILERLNVLGKPAPTLALGELLQGEWPDQGAQPKAADSLTSSARTSGALKTEIRIPAGQVAWLEFFQPECPHCEKALPSQLSHIEEAMDSGVWVGWIGSMASSRKKAEAGVFLSYLEKWPRPGFAAMDFNRSESFRRMAGQGTPWTVLVDRSGIVRYAGVYKEAPVRAALQELLEESPE